MTDHHELDDFRTALEVLHSYALESPTLNQRGIPRLLERLRNITGAMAAKDAEQRSNKRPLP